MPRILLFSLVGALAALTFGVARAEPLAVTVDDLPVFSLREDPAEAIATTRALTDGLRRCHIPATGFVVGEKYASHPRLRSRLLRMWRARGLTLGNHTYSHTSLNALQAAAYIRDIARDDRVLASVGAFRPRQTRWFRHPFLETGPDAERRGLVEAWLASHGYRIAPVTLEADDDIFAAPYEAAVRRGDAGHARAVREAYLAFTQARIDWYRSAGEALFGRRPALVLLLHASRLNADALPALCGVFARAGLQPVPLAQALDDPAYALPDGPPTADGDDWFNRWATVLGRDLPWDSFPEAPAAIRAESERLDPDSH